MSRMNRSVTGGIFAVVLAAVIVGTTATAASAHESLASSSPAEGERFDVAPTQVELVFTDEVLPMGAAIVVVDESGHDWVLGDPVIEGASVVVQLTDGLPDAGYQVRWRVVSGDGHPISSLIPFTIGDGEPFTTTTTSTPTPAPIESVGNGDEPQASVWPLLLLGIGGAVTALGIYAGAVYFVRRARTARAASSHTPQA